MYYETSIRCLLLDTKLTLLFPLWTESQPYQDVDQGAVGGDNAVAGVGALRLDDETEFPPMTQKNDWKCIEYHRRAMSPRSRVKQYSR